VPQVDAYSPNLPLYGNFGMEKSSCQKQIVNFFNEISDIAKYLSSNKKNIPITYLYTIFNR